MRAFVMAAGRGTRLQPLTDVLPKPALPVGNEPVMGRLLRLLARHGIQDVAVNAWWRAEDLQRIFGDGSAWGVRIEWSVEDEPLGTAGGLKHLEAFLRQGDEPVLVLSGDGLHDVDLSELVRLHKASGALATLALARVVDPSQYGVAVIDDDGTITGFQEKPAPGTEASNLSNTGIYVFSPELFDLIPEGFYDFGSELFPRVIAEDLGTLHGVEIEGYWNDIGNFDAYRLGNLAVADGGVGDERASGDHGEGLLVHPGAEIASDAVLEGPLVVGSRVTVGAGACVSHSLLLPGAVVVPGEAVLGGILGTLEGLEAWSAELG